MTLSRWFSQHFPVQMPDLRSYWAERAARSTRIDRISVRCEPLADGCRIQAQYRLSADPDDHGAVVFDAARCAGDIDSITCPARGRGGMRPLVLRQLVIFQARRDASWDGALVDVVMRWNASAMERLRGAPYLVLPDHLPSLLYVPEGGAMTKPAALPRVVLISPVPDELTVGGVGAAVSRDAEEPFAQVPLLQLLLYRPRLGELVVPIADGQMLLTGLAAHALTDAQRDQLSRTARDVLSFLADQYQVLPRARPILAIEPPGANASRGFGSMLVETQARCVVGTRNPAWWGMTLARELSSLWWGVGCRPRAEVHPWVTLAVAHALSLRWLDTAGDEQARHEIIDKHRRAAAGEVGQELPDTERQARQRLLALGLALYDRMRNDGRVLTMIRELTVQHWGMSLPPQLLERKFEEVGVHLPSHVAQGAQ